MFTERKYYYMAQLKIEDLQKAEYVQPKHIMKIYSLGRTTVWKLLTEMRATPKYKKSFRDLGYHLKLVKRADFERFLQDRSNQYLKD